MIWCQWFQIFIIFTQYVKDEYSQGFQLHWTCQQTVRIILSQAPSIFRDEDGFSIHWIVCSGDLSPILMTSNLDTLIYNSLTVPLDVVPQKPIKDGHPLDNCQLIICCMVLMKQSLSNNSTSSTCMARIGIKTKMQP